MNMLRNILELLTQLKEEHLGTIQEILKRLIAQQNKGSTKFLHRLEEFLRGEIQSLWIPTSQPPVGGRFSSGTLQHLTYPDCEFDENLFELIQCDPSFKEILQFHDHLVLILRRRPVNSHLVVFFRNNPAAFPDNWKGIGILVTGTFYVGSNTLRKNVPCACIMRYRHVDSTIDCQNIALQESPTTGEYILCYKD